MFSNMVHQYFISKNYTHIFFQIYVAITEYISNFTLKVSVKYHYMMPVRNCYTNLWHGGGGTEALEHGQPLARQGTTGCAASSFIATNDSTLAPFSHQLKESLAYRLKTMETIGWHHCPNMDYDVTSSYWFHSMEPCVGSCHICDRFSAQNASF